MDQEGTYKWIQDRLRDLHSGTLSESDRIRLVELSKNDPFLSDALEGYHAHSLQDHASELTTLSRRIKNKGHAKRRKLLPTSRGWIIQAVAASLVLILVTWAVMYYVSGDEKNVLVSSEPEISSQREASETAISDADSAYEEMPTGVGSPDELNEEPAGLRANAQARIKAEAKEGPEDYTSTKTDQEESSTFSNPVTSSIPPTPVLDQEIATAQEASDDESIVTDGDDAKKSIARDEGYYANQMNPARMAERVTGQVIDGFGEPVIGALLTIPNTNLETTTDFYARFELYLPEPSATVKITHPGYADTTVSFSQGQEDRVVMLTGGLTKPSFGNARATEFQYQQSTSDVASGPVPSNRAATFLEYLKSNSRFPIQTSFSPSAKEVMLEFVVNANGKPGDIKKIKPSTGNKFSTEAIRLIQKGPDWMCEDGKYPCTKQYTIYFE